MKGSFPEVIIRGSFLFGAMFFLIGSIQFLPSYYQYIKDGVIMFLIGSLCYTLGSSLDTILMISTNGCPSKRVCMSSIFSIVGCLLFVLGSFLMLPQFGVESGRKGLWLFIFGCIFFILSASFTLSIAWKDFRYKTSYKNVIHREFENNSDQDHSFFVSPLQKLKVIPLWIFIINFGMLNSSSLGSFLFIVGSFLSLDTREESATWCFIIGSCFFILSEQIAIFKSVISSS